MLIPAYHNGCEAKTGVAHGECSWVQVLSLLGSAVWVRFASGGIGTRDQCFSQNGGAEVEMSVKCLLVVRAHGSRCVPFMAVLFGWAFASGGTGTPRQCFKWCCCLRTLQSSSRIVAVSLIWPVSAFSFPCSVGGPWHLGGPIPLASASNGVLVCGLCKANLE